jgi:hypothetical protein
MKLTILVGGATLYSVPNLVPMEEPTPNIPCPLGPLLFQRLMVNVVEAHGNVITRASKVREVFVMGVPADNLFPLTLKGQLDAELLKTMRLTKERITRGDALFFTSFSFQYGIQSVQGSKSMLKGLSTARWKDSPISMP